MLDSRSDAVSDVVSTALGRAHRDDPVLPSTGGPAGNARLTAWLGVVLLVLFVAECVTLLSLQQLISWHIVIGVVLVPLVIGKTAATGWRIIRYYTRDSDYVFAGPPPLLLRVLGPLVVVTGLAVLGTGLALIALGPSSRSTLISIGPRSIDPLMLHKAAFVVWLAVTALHALGRLVPALRIIGGRTTPHRVPGTRSRGLLVTALVVIGVVGGFITLAQSRPWTGAHPGFERLQHHDHH